MIRFACPYCGKQLSAPEECAGRSSKCQGCGQTVTVPGTRPQLVTVICPACKNLCLPATPGDKIFCTVCGQKVLVPMPPQNKTVLGEWPAAAPTALPQSQEPPYAIPLGQAPLPRPAEPPRAIPLETAPLQRRRRQGGYNDQDDYDLTPGYGPDGSALRFLALAVIGAAILVALAIMLSTPWGRLTLHQFLDHK
jgi:hypothetical protein